MMPKIGEMNRRIAIQRFSVEQNEFNEDVETWAPFIEVWAQRRDVSDGEKFASGQTGSSLRSRFTIRRSSQSATVTPVDRIEHDGAVWQIVGAKEASDNPRAFIELTAVRDAD